VKGIEVPCQRIVEMVTDYVEGALSPEQHRLVEEHLADCEPCRRYLQQIELTIRALRTVEEDDLSADAWRQLRTVFARAGDRPTTD
jgi:predicted anti-sigma-YlaC factor YlaD